MTYRRLQRRLLTISIILFFSKIPTCCYGFQSSSRTLLRRVVVPGIDIDSSYNQKKNCPTSFQSRRMTASPRIGKRGVHYQLQSLTQTRDYMKQLERYSGKDYRWIKPLKTPVSRLMKYVCKKCSCCSSLWIICVASRVETRQGKPPNSQANVYISLLVSLSPPNPNENNVDKI